MWGGGFWESLLHPLPPNMSLLPFSFPHQVEHLALLGHHPQSKGPCSISMWQWTPLEEEERSGRKRKFPRFGSDSFERTEQTQRNNSGRAELPHQREFPGQIQPLFSIFFYYYYFFPPHLLPHWKESNLWMEKASGASTVPDQTASVTAAFNNE